MAALVLVSAASPSFAQVPSVRRITASDTDTATTSDGPIGTIAWAYPDQNSKTETLFACTSLGTTPTTGYLITIKDEIGTSSAYSIQINPAPTNTIDGLASYALKANHGSVTLQCDGAGNWMLE